MAPVAFVLPHGCFGPFVETYLLAIVAPRCSRLGASGTCPGTAWLCRECIQSSWVQTVRLRTLPVHSSLGRPRALTLTLQELLTCLVALTPRSRPGDPAGSVRVFIGRLHMAETPPDFTTGDASPAAPASRRGQLVNVVAVPDSPAAAPTTPPAPSPPACPSTDACPVCLCEFPSHAHGSESPFYWPSCGHALHLGCVAHLVANVRELRSPTCRTPWPPEAANAFSTACCTHGAQAPQPAPDDTTSHQYHEALAPRPPVHILPFCCPRLMLVWTLCMQCRRLPETTTCIGHQPAHDKPADDGRRSGFACAATQPSTRAMPYFKPCLHRQFAPLMAPVG